MQQDDILIDVQNVSKRFCKDLKRSMRYGFMDSLRAIAGRDATATDLRKDEFWAVKDVSFQLRRSECLGLIGHNGAGKSTLLKMLNGLINPDQGKIIMRGKIGALIELGAGFNPILTGRENIYNNGAVLGFPRKEIDAKVDAIIDFAEVREFIDAPVQNYSSGMRVRLGFAVAAQMEPDILLIDEVLAVGDLKFVLKCLSKIDSLLHETAVIFVSHNMPMVSRICNKLLFMEHGKEKFSGTDVSKGLDLYYAEHESEVGFSKSDDAELESIKIINIDQLEEINGIPQFKRYDDLFLDMVLKVKSDYPNPRISIKFLDQAQRPIAVAANDQPLDASISEKISEGYNRYIVSLKIRKLIFSKGVYYVAISLTGSLKRDPLLRINNAVRFQMTGDNALWVPIELDSDWQQSAHIEKR